MANASSIRALRGVDVLRDRDRQAHDDAGRRAAGRLGGCTDGGRDVLGDRAGTGHPGHGAVGDGARQLEHGGTQCGDEDRRRRGIADVQGCEGVGRDALARAPHRLASQERHERGQVLPHVARRLVVAHAPHALHHHLVRQADAQEEPVAGRPLHGEGLLRQHHRVARVHRHHTRTQADAGYLRAGHGEQGQCVGPEYLRGEGVVEARLRGPPQLGHHVGQRLVDVDHAPDPQRSGHVPGAPRVVCPLCPPHCLGESPDGGEQTEHPSRRVRGGGPAGAHGG